jgi:hypothetical protein
LGLRRAALLLLAAIVLSGGGYLSLLPDDDKDQLIWKGIVLKELSREKIINISAGPIQLSAPIPPEQYPWVIQELKKADFYQSNRRGFGPTPERTLLV